ncbi:MAG: hypothetical protein RJA19_184 [Bacteroidota bacterium]
MKGFLMVCMAWLFSLGMGWSQESGAPQQAAPPGKGITITGSDGQSPVPFAVVFNRGTLEARMADANGRVIPPVRGAQDTLVVQCVGFMDLIILPQEVIPKRIRMVDDLVSLDVVEVVARGSRGKEKGTGVNISGLSGLRIAPVKRIEVPLNAADLLWSTGSVLVQESQQGGGSPVLRGFEANRVLLVVDGVRMNNAIYRAGHLQNAVTVDPNALQRTEVVLGPHSVMYGSDALGGVIHYQTRRPTLSEPAVHGRGMVAYRSPNQSWNYHASAEISRLKWASITSFSHSIFGDLRMGSRRPHGDANWGLVQEYAAEVDGRDTVLTNPDPRVQVGSGYKQWDFMQRLQFQMPSGSLGVNLQYSTSSDVPRYDVMDDRISGNLRWAEWYYGPQERMLASLNYVGYVPALRSTLNITANVQRIGEDRINRRMGDDWRYHQEETVDVAGFNGNMAYTGAAGWRWTAGLAGSWNGVTSVAYRAHRQSGLRENQLTRYPDGGSVMRTMGLYGLVRKQWGPHIFSAGARYSHVYLLGRYESQEFFTLPNPRIESEKGAVTGSVAMQWKLTPSLFASSSVGSGFRHPNVDDAVKIREKSGMVQLPNDSLRPEYLYSLEQTLTWNLGGGDALQVTGGAFYTFWEDAIITVNATLPNGDTTFVFQGDTLRTQTLANAARANIWGARAELGAQITPTIGLQGTMNWTYGKDWGSGEPLAHIPPTFGRVAMDYEYRWLTVVASVQYNLAKPIANYGPDGEDNEDEALPTGTPAWWTLNAELAMELSENWQMQVGVRNILDQHYQVFSSGIAAAGRGLYASLHAAF